MKHGLALIISQTSSSSAEVVEHLQQADWKTAAAAPTEAFPSAARLSPKLIVICACDASTTDSLLQAFKLDRRTTCIRVVVCGEPPGGDAVRVLPDAQAELQNVAAAADADLSPPARCEVTFRVPNHCRFIDALTLHLDHLYKQFKVDAENNHRLTTAVREMVHNAIEWGNRGVADASVIVICRIETTIVVIRVRDSGAGFNRETLPHAATSQDPTRHLGVRDALGLRAGGFGILMTRGLVDELSYNESGNEVRIVKRLAGPT